MALAASVGMDGLSAAILTMRRYFTTIVLSVENGFLRFGGLTQESLLNTKCLQDVILG